MKLTKKAKQNKSFLQAMTAMMRIQLFLALVLMVLFLVFTWRNTQERQRTELGNYTAIYASQIENRRNWCTTTPT
mgnify:CR=1 FL=1